MSYTFESTIIQSPPCSASGLVWVEISEGEKVLVAGILVIMRFQEEEVEVEGGG